MDTSVPARSPGATPRPRLWTGMQWPVVLLLLALTALAAWQTQRLIATLQQARFNSEMQRTDAAIQERMRAYTQVLRGGLGLFLSSQDVTREEWRQFVEALRLGEHYPGFKVFTFAPAVRQEELPAFLAAVRAEPLPAGVVDPTAISAFTLSFGGQPAVPLPLHAPILYTAPFTPDNQLALGLDLMQDPLRRGMLEQAAASGEAVLSPRIKLMQRIVPRDGTLSEASFINVLAIKRGEQLVGWLTAACKAEQFMRALLGNDRPALDIEIFDGMAPEPDSLLYSTAGVDAQGGPVPLGPVEASALTHSSRIKVSSRHWTVRYRAPPAFFQLSEILAPWLVALAGVLATLLFHAIARAGASWRAQAESLRVAESAVRYQATHDALTGLANRVLFMHRLQDTLERTRRREWEQHAALIYIDIDGFKPVNDTHGHHVGDELLKAIAQRLKARLRREDTAARLGGDEFALVLEDAVKPRDELQRLGDDLIELLKQPYEIHAADKVLTITVGASIGIAEFPGQGVDADALIVAADAAMYRAKRSGRNRCELAA